MNTHRVKVAMRRWKARVEKAIPPAVGEANSILEGEARRRAPVLTGELAGKIEATEVHATPKRVVGAVKCDSDHALSTEFGNADQSPRPFWRPAIHAALPKMQAVIRKVIGS